MARPIIEIKDFSKGMVSDITKGTGFDTLFCCDIHRNPGILAIQRLMEEEDDDIFQTNGEFPLWFAIYNDGVAGTELYAYCDRGGIYVRDKTNSFLWTFVRDSGSQDGQGFTQFGDSLYYARRNWLGQLQGDRTVGGNFTDNFKSFANNMSSGDYAQMVVFAGSLYVCNLNKVAKLESDEITWDNSVFEIPDNLTLVSMCIWNNKLVLSTRSGSETAAEYIYIWDGISEFAEQIIQVPKPGATAVFNHNNFLKAFIANKIYKYTGSEFEIETIIPGKVIGEADDTKDNIYIRPGAVVLYEDRMLFGLTTVLPGNILSGVWSYGRAEDSLPNALVYEFMPSTEDTLQTRIGAITVYSTSNDKENLYMGYADVTNAEYHVDKIAYNRNPTDDAYIITAIYELPGDFGNLVEGVRIDFALPMRDSQIQNNVNVYYRVDEDIIPDDRTANWTHLGIIDNDPDENNNAGEILRGIYKKAHRIQFKFLLKSNSFQVNTAMAIQRIRIY